MVSGGRRPPSSPSTVAPINRSGSATRPIGRRRSASVPSSVAAKGWPASKPASRRMVVPEPAQNSTSSGWVRPRSPLPLMLSKPGFSEKPGLLTSSISAPSACMQRLVARHTSAGTHPSISISPSAMDPSMRARCVMDLSPGAVTVPRSGPDDRMIRSAMFLLIRCAARCGVPAPGQDARATHPRSQSRADRAGLTIHGCTVAATRARPSGSS